jgi:hypothetical protein
MPRPNLIHPVEVEFQLLTRSETFYDPQAREPVRQVVRKGIDTGATSVVIKGQISFYYAGAKLDYPEWLREGVLEHTVGYVALRFYDMNKKGLVVYDSEGNFQEFLLKRGDKVIRLGHRTVELFVTGFKDFAFYPNMNQTMIQINFEDRHPTAQGGDL